MLILGIESSCDETAAAVVEDGRIIHSNIVSTQIEEHKKFGGVVPEIASRRHCENIYGVVEAALSEANCTLADIDAIGVTYAPGLIGALLVGTSFAKGLAMASGKPLVPVHHIAGHIAANYIAHHDLKPPYLCLIASGGHSMIAEIKDYTKFSIIGRTRDDAAGEAFDKAARVLGFPYPGGVHIDKAAKEGNPDAYKLPYPKVTGSEYDFSFSGLKTAVINTVHNSEQKGIPINKNDMAASFQHTISEILVSKTMAAAREYGYKTIAVAGGVSANSGVRELTERRCRDNGFKLYLPPLNLCGDNAAMIAAQAYFDYLDGKRADESLNAVATLPLDNI
ncbi:MAG: tRNA (adenosine(37)-N6)-threonylcarbamoyltransferase complex transferase subunit TsaD [Oscillospiraceae bacterium]|nr:tRNA (adenosine(37)-N6)-threonylcarbamoyltransferase complex transferase subunit TsaD [Oscillospiraceae bacterium]